MRPQGSTPTNTERAVLTARARTTDPQTSHDAAKRVKGVSMVQNTILLILWTGGPMTDLQIAEAYYERVADGTAPNQSESGLRTRRKELVDMGKISATGEKRRLDSGRYANVWAWEQKA